MCNCAENGKGLKTGIKEADTIKINNRAGGISKDEIFGYAHFCFIRNLGRASVLKVS